MALGDIFFLHVNRGLFVLVQRGILLQIGKGKVALGVPGRLWQVNEGTSLHTVGATLPKSLFWFLFLRETLQTNFL